MFCFFAADCIYAKEVGSLTLKKGVVRIRRSLIDTLYTQPGKKIIVHERDEIQTGADTRGIIDITAKGDNIDLYPNTFLTIDEVAEKSRYSMPVGKVYIKVNKPKLRNKKRRFRLRAANASIGVKGTEFVVGVQGDTTNLLTVSGIVTMANINAPEVEVEVAQNQATRIVANQKPAPPVEVTPEVKEAIIKSDTTESFQKIEIKETPAEASQKKQSSTKTKTTKTASGTQSTTAATPDSSEETASTNVDTPEEEVEVEEIDVDEITEEVSDEVDEVAEDEVDDTDTTITITIVEE